MSADDEMVQVPRREWEAMQARAADHQEPAPGSAAVVEPGDRSVGGLTGRRGVLKHGAMLMAGAVVGASALVVAEAGPAEATTGTMKFGASNNAGAATTTLTSTANPTLRVASTAGGISVLATDSGTGTGTPLEVAVDNPLNTSPMALFSSVGGGDGIQSTMFGGPGTAVTGAIQAGGAGTGVGVHGTIEVHGNSSAAVQADTIGLGPALAATIDSVANFQPAILTTTNGRGAGVSASLTQAANPAAAVDATTNGVGPAVAGTIDNASSGASAVSGITNGTGAAVVGQITNASSSSVAVGGVTNGTGAAFGGLAVGAGPAVQALVWGTGAGVVAQVVVPSNSQAAVSASTAGTGAAVQGTATGAGSRGGVFGGVAAQLQLVAGAASSHPTSGQTGDLYLDSSSRLWLCTTGGGTATWKQVQLA